jgi:hypothetical protein
LLDPGDPLAGDGRIAMVLNPVDAEMSSERRASLYDEIEGDDGPSGTAEPSGVLRAPLSLVVSVDGGASFPERRDLETGSGYCLTNDSVNGLNLTRSSAHYVSQFTRTSRGPHDPSAWHTERELIQPIGDYYCIPCAPNVS